MFRIPPPAGLVRSTLLASAAVFASPFDAQAQSERTNLPPVTVTAPEQKRAAGVRPPRNATRSAPTVRQVRAPAPQTAGDQGQGGRGALAVLSAQQALTEINNTPGGVALVPAAAYKNSTVANTIKDILDYVPGVFAQPKWGDDTRLSIRGSSLSRNFHLRGVQLYMDGIPINTADGYGDFQEIDPTAYKYVEVWKGANALQYGAQLARRRHQFRDSDRPRSMAERSVGRYGRIRISSGCRPTPAARTVRGTVSSPRRRRRPTAFRDHSFGSSTRVSGNVGYQFSPDAETRFYFNANEIRQRIPGSVTKQSALTDPQAAAPANVATDQQRNIDTVRLANKTTIRFDDTKVEFGAFGVDRHLMHPIFQWLDYSYKDYGGFAKVTDDRFIGGFRNRVGRRRQHPQRQHRQPAIRQYRRAEGRTAVVLDRSLEKHLALCREQLLLPAERGGDRRHAIPLRHPRPAGSLSQRWRSIGSDRVQSVDPEGRPALERRSDLAGLRQYLAQRRGAELRRKRERSRE